jgi:uncharacterized protein (DUF433 family)
MKVYHFFAIVVTRLSLLKCYPHLNAADLANAWAYTETHPEEIEAAIARNEEA